MGVANSTKHNVDLQNRVLQNMWCCRANQCWAVIRNPSQVSGQFLVFIIEVLKRIKYPALICSHVIKKSNTWFWYIATILNIVESIKWLPKTHQVLHETQQFFEGFETPTTGSSLILIFSNITKQLFFFSFFFQMLETSCYKQNPRIVQQ